MFFINESGAGLNLVVVDEHHKPVKHSGDLVIIQNIKQLTVIGKNTIHDNFITAYLNKKNLTFIGTEIVKFNTGVPVEMYKLANDAGFIFYDKQERYVYASRSFYQLINYCLGLGFSILGIIRKSSNAAHVIPQMTINNDFSKKKITAEDIDTDRHLSFDLLWNRDEDQLEFDMIIENDGYNINKENPFYEEYTGTAVNIGKFRKTILKPLEEGDRVPDLFPELELMNCITFTELFDDNAEHVLVPNIMTQLQYKSLIKEMRSVDRRQLSYSGTSHVGYGVQVELELLDEADSTAEYEARIKRIIISPEDQMLQTFLKI